MEMQTKVDGSKSEGSGEQRQDGHYGDVELATRVFVVQSKRFFVDVKQNKLGRSIKIAETAIGGYRRHLIMPIGAAAKFCERLEAFIKFFDEIVSGEHSPICDNGQLKSESVMFGFRCYYVDLKENGRGRYLRVSQGAVRSPSGLRLQIAVPALGMVQLKETMSELISKYGDGYLENDNLEAKLPKSQRLRIENKRFFLDADHNERGTYLRISEVNSINGKRSAIAIPQSGWIEMYKKLGEIMNKGANEGNTENRDKLESKLAHGNTN